MSWMWPPVFVSALILIAFVLCWRVGATCVCFDNIKFFLKFRFGSVYIFACDSKKVTRHRIIETPFCI